ncbi:MAG TPA: MBL fold metallo-hydrolase [Candidatus Methylomirabilis sp.]|nr:MBL fold metallo-hydrolase [Candidatus Methylomirabilis sp.]
MLVRFWGTRGSLPVPLTSTAVQQKLVAALVAAAGKGLDTPEKAREFIQSQLAFPTGHTFGGNTACVQIETGDSEYVLCDLGSGVRAFGGAVLATHGPAHPHTFHVFLSHVHWDHIMGFPFFAPAYIPGNRIRIYGCHAGLQEALRRQHGPPSFPVEFGRLGAAIEFARLEPGRSQEIAGLRVIAMRQRHAGDSYGYRFEREGKILVYSTDSEHRLEDVAETQAFVEFFHEADLVIFDAQYSLADAVSLKEDWGHSSNIVGVELCQMARAKHLCLFHHEPVLDDEQLAAVLQETRRLEEITQWTHRVRVSAAYDGMEIAL